LQRKKLISSATLVSIPLLLISLQNAYTFSLIDQSHFLGHSLNYIALFIGAGMFILWRWHYSVFIVVLSGIITVLFAANNPNLVLKDALVQGGLLLLVTSLFTIFLIQVRFKATVKIIEGKLALEDANQALAAQKQVIEAKNRNITDSIRYARRIQQAILPLPEKLANNLGKNDFFVYYQPKDIVSGDFYFLEEVNHASGARTVFIAAADCTGHGVPGALMSMIGSQLLHEAITKNQLHQTQQILQSLHEGVLRVLKQKETNTNDGMDIAILALEQAPDEANFGSITFSGAKNELIYFQNQTCHEVRGDRRSIGGQETKNQENRPFTSQQIQLGTPTVCYLFSDGYRDQMGGEQGRKFGSKQLRELLQRIHLLPMAEQKEILTQTIKDWLGNRPQIDDILVVGLRV
jgi:phosphoserine phosphatase RsbU/P